MLLGHSLKEFGIPNLLSTKKILEQPTNAFFLYWWHLAPLKKPHNDGITSYSA
jgi:hypothetical protein